MSTHDLLYSLLSYLGQRLISFTERWMRLTSRFPGSLPPWIERFCISATDLRSEFLCITDHSIPEFGSISPEQLRITTGNSWKVYILKAYGRRLRQNELRCPYTTRLVESVPEITTALFSVLEPGTHITPHRGPYAGVLRCHIPLVVPDGDCGIRVGTQVHRWQVGVPLVFDDTIEHEAWNRTTERRVVLFIDFLRPLPFPLATLNKLMIWLIGHSPFIGRALRASL